MNRRSTMLSLALVASLGFAGLTGCSQSQDSSDNNASTAQESKAPLSLVGEWAEADPKSDQMQQTATITADSIEINWVQSDGTRALYWSGSYVPPTNSDDSYTWDSANNTEKTKSAILASSDPTKTFTYSDGSLSYEVSAMGVTATAKLERK